MVTQPAPNSNSEHSAMSLDSKPSAEKALTAARIDVSFEDFVMYINEIRTKTRHASGHATPVVSFARWVQTRYQLLQPAQVRAIPDRSYAGIDLSGGDFSGVCFAYADLSHADLTGCQCRDTDFSYSNLSHAHASYSNFTHANLQHVRADDTDFKAANLEYANMQYGSFQGASFHQAHLSEVQYCHESGVHDRFNGAPNLSQTDFRQALGREPLETLQEEQLYEQYSDEKKSFHGLLLAAAFAICFPIVLVAHEMVGISIMLALCIPIGVAGIAITVSVIANHVYDEQYQQALRLLHYKRTAVLETSDHGASSDPHILPATPPTYHLSSTVMPLDTLSPAAPPTPMADIFQTEVGHALAKWDAITRENHELRERLASVEEELLALRQTYAHEHALVEVWGQQLSLSGASNKPANLSGGTRH